MALPDESIWIGYQLKHVTPWPGGRGVPWLETVASVSTCVARSADPLESEAPWQLNEFGLRASPEELAPRPGQELRALRMLPWKFDGDTEGAFEVALETAVAAPAPGDYPSIGWDAVSRSCGSGLECSPISCNGMAPEVLARGLRVQPNCLFATREDAIAAARWFAQGHGEPGPYFVIEVCARTAASPA